MFAAIMEIFALIAHLVNTLVTMERPAPDSQAVGYAADRERTVAQSHIRMGASHEERTICRVGCHAETIAVAVAEVGGEVRSLGVIPNRDESVSRLVKKLGRAEQLRVCYDAGPTGYALQAR